MGVVDLPPEAKKKLSLVWRKEGYPGDLPDALRRHLALLGAIFDVLRWPDYIKARVKPVKQEALRPLWNAD